MAESLEMAERCERVYENHRLEAIYDYGFGGMSECEIDSIVTNCSDPSSAVNSTKTYLGHRCTRCGKWFPRGR